MPTNTIPTADGGEREFTLGDRVEKKRGYKFPGEVVSVFETLSGELRYVVECTAEGVAGCLHIYSGKDLESTL